MSACDIPPFTISGALPPFASGDPTDPSTLSPYRTNLVKLVERYGTSPRRLQILAGLLAYRDGLMKIGIGSGFQWLDGSFLENVEVTEKRDPGDLDLVTFFRRPPNATATADMRQLAQSNLALFDPTQAKLNYSCDAYFVDLDVEVESVVDQTRYWFGLFSHKRTTFLWKGILQVELGDTNDEAAAMQLIQARIAS